MEGDLWQAHWAGNDSARLQLLDLYMPLAKRLAAMLYAKRPNNAVEFGDYLHLAYLGLIESVQRFRQESSAQFATFASYRIKGSVLNGLPKMTEAGDHIDYLKRAHRDRTKSLLEGDEKKLMTFGGITDLVIYIALTYQLEELVAESGLEPEEHSPYKSYTYDNMQERIKQALSRLSTRDQQIIRYHYFDQCSFEQIATFFNITKGRVSQLHKRTLQQLRAELAQKELEKSF